MGLYKISKIFDLVKNTHAFGYIIKFILSMTKKRSKIISKGPSIRNTFNLSNHTNE